MANYFIKLRYQRSNKLNTYVSYKLYPHQVNLTPFRNKTNLIITKLYFRVLYSQYNCNITVEILGSMSMVFTAWHVKRLSRSLLATAGHVRRFSMTSPALCSYSSSTSTPFTSHRTEGSGWPPTVRHVIITSSPSSWGPTLPLSIRPHLSRITGCSGGTEMEWQY